jgi:dienelactone hydrolase
LAWVYTHALLHPGCQGDFASLAERGFPAEQIVFSSPAGYSLRGWFSPGDRHPEIAIILLPGHAGNTRFALDDAAILADAGFSTLVYEHRSCANPELIASTGYWESQDLLGAVDYLASRDGVAHIGAMGFSEGGTAIILAAARQPRLEAVVPMGGYASLRDDILDPGSPNGAYGSIMRQLVLWMTALYGVPISGSEPVAVIGDINPRPLLLIYGESEGSAGALLEAAGPTAQLWIVPGAGHGGYANHDPAEYRQRITGFFTEAFSLNADP